MPSSWPSFHPPGERGRRTRPAKPCLSVRGFIYPVSRLALDGLHDLGNRKGTVFVGERREDEVDVVRHHDSRVQNASLAVDMCAGFESEVAGEIGEMPALMGSECNEEGPIVFSGCGADSGPGSCTVLAWLKLSMKQDAGESPAATWAARDSKVGIGLWVAGDSPAPWPPLTGCTGTDPGLSRCRPASCARSRRPL